jgi:para-nitrobenzyl esterase
MSSAHQLPVLIAVSALAACASSTSSQSPATPVASTAASKATTLEGTAWRLVEFKGGDDTVLTPDDRAKYTIEFGADGRVSARIDCNRGGGTWTSSGPNQLQFGPLALTRMMCPPGSLHDQIAKQWGNVRSYVIKDGHLYLSLMADGGIYEYEPMPATAQPPKP